jgi:hypothetical protein
MNWKYALLVVSVLCLASPALAVNVGDPAPPFTHNTLDHGQISLSDYSGKIIYLFFLGHN